MTRNQIVVKLLEYRDQFHILHWQTKSFAQHKAFDETYTNLLALTDDFVEAMSGKYGNMVVESQIKLVNTPDIKLDAWLNEIVTFLKSFDSVVKDTDLLNIRDEMLGVIHKLKYLLRLE
jgi:hypothetical protein